MELQKEQKEDTGLRVLSARIQSAERVEAATMPYTTFTPASPSSSAGDSLSFPPPATRTASAAPGSSTTGTVRAAFTVYLLDVRCAVGREAFTVATFRRYSEFRALDQQLGRAALTALLPPRRALGHLGAPVVRARAAQLQRYLDALLRDPRAARAPAVLAFLCPVAERRRAPSPLLQDRVAFVIQSALLQSGQSQQGTATSQQVSSPQQPSQQQPLRTKELCLSLDSTPIRPGRPKAPKPTLATLPEPLLLRIFAGLGVRGLLAVARTCRRLYVVASQNALWAPLLARCCPAWPAAVVDAPALDLRTSSKRALLRLCRACAPRRRAFQPPAPCLRCPCPLRRTLAVLAGPAAHALHRALAGAQHPAADAAFAHDTATVCVHAPCAAASSWCFHVHLAASSCSDNDSTIKTTTTTTTTTTTSPPCTVIYGHSNHEKLTAFFLLRSNFVIITFFWDDETSMRDVFQLVERARELCPLMPIFLVGVPSKPQEQQQEEQQQSRLKALEMGISLGAIKYIEMRKVDTESTLMLLSEIGTVLSPALCELPRAAAAAATLAPLLSEEQSLVDVDEDCCIGELSPRATTEEDPQSRRTAQAVVRGAREHFLQQLERLSIDGVVREYEASALDLETKAANLKLFVASMADYVHRTPLWRTASAREKTLAAHELEEYVFERLYAALFRPPQDRAADREIEQQIARLGFVLPAHLDIPRALWDSDAWAAAADELQNMNYCASPFGKMHCLMNCTKILLRSLQARATRGETSADHFLPHLVYVLIRANPPFLASNIAFVQRFASDAVRTSEASYYWTSLEVAVSFILQITSKSLRISDADFARLTSATVEPLPPRLDTLPLKLRRSLGIEQDDTHSVAPELSAVPSARVQSSNIRSKEEEDEEDEDALNEFYRERALTRRASVAAGTLNSAAAANAAAQFLFAMRGTQPPEDADTLPLLDFDDDDENEEKTKRKTTGTRLRTRPRSDAVGTHFNLSTESLAGRAPTPVDALDGMPAKPSGAAPRAPSVTAQGHAIVSSPSSLIGQH